jgi:hypothetical protein
VTLTAKEAISATISPKRTAVDRPMNGRSTLTVERANTFRPPYR